MFPHLCGTWCTVFIFSCMNEIPPFHSKLFLHIFFKLCAHGVSHPPPLTHTQPCPLCTSPHQWGPSVSPNLYCSRSLIGCYSWAFFWKEAGIGVPRSLTVYTHTVAGSNWVNEGESRGAMESGFTASHPRIPKSFLQLCFQSLVLLWTFQQLFCVHLFSSYWSE